MPTPAPCAGNDNLQQAATYFNEPSIYLEATP